MWGPETLIHPYLRFDGRTIVTEDYIFYDEDALKLTDRDFAALHFVRFLRDPKTWWFSFLVSL